MWLKMLEDRFRNIPSVSMIEAGPNRSEKPYAKAEKTDAAPKKVRFSG